jgi:hypothetical protein
MKLILFILVLYILKRTRRRKLPPLEADIVISPGGFRGVYTNGICHYVKNHFNVKNKTFAGFSSGSFNSLFMVLDDELNNIYIKKLTELKKRPIHQFLDQVIHIIHENFETDQFDLSRIHVAVSTSNGLEYFKHFLTLKEALSCCKCSSFVPFITCHDLFMFYKSKLTLDGAIFYRHVKKEEKRKLFISPNMFGRYTPNSIPTLFQPKESMYQMYLNGYHDARKNHAFFELFFRDSS